MATKRAVPAVQLTKLFRAALIADGANPQVMLAAFADWKTDWPAWEDLDYYFGKDAFYTVPKRSNRSVVRQVHMPPEDPANWPASTSPLSSASRKKIEAELREWNRLWTISERQPGKPTSARYRVSSRVLVYVDGGRHGYLLLHLGREPEGHDETTADICTMEMWADVAEAFIHDGTILI
ncbi:hypothetical protein GT347_09670 [Xylophilus rhododendri]|uniref:Uncharacterized protein n=1 Tax=Xylophilus rhododendri TaxID=2697032 RepID=A0A857J3J1_9BURK|nr:hypothetical protein [Xylophilus rhododendri]QHI98237.1 hypothetical protein GT347_09670 [Xylophilus rhododendri]